MRYTLLLHYPEPTPEELGPDLLAEGQRAFAAYADALARAALPAQSRPGRSRQG